MKILLSWSSGKDSAWALHVLNQTYPGCVAALLTTVNEAFDRVAMHGVRIDVLAGAGARGTACRCASCSIPDQLLERGLRQAHAAARSPMP